MPEYKGILFIGDPHLASRPAGFRKDDYPRVSLAKLAWCLDYARDESLLPAILGDLFHHPRDNANWLMGELLALLGRQKVLGIYGNHDCRENQLGDDDSMTVVAKAARLHMADADGPWIGVINGRTVVVGGTSWRQPLPTEYAAPTQASPSFAWKSQATQAPELRPLVFWMCHDDVALPGYEMLGRFPPREIPGIDVIVNGHVHYALEDAQVGSTLWITPGNISRITRTDAIRRHLPAILRIDILPTGWRRRMITVPHEPFDNVFFEKIIEPTTAGTESEFIRGLAELRARRTQSGAGLMDFVNKNLDQFEPEVAAQVVSLAMEVTDGDHQEDN